MAPVPPNQNQINQMYADLQNLANQLGKNLSSYNLHPILSDVGQIRQLLGEWQNELDSINRSTADIAAGFREVVSELSSGRSSITETRKSFNSLVSITKQLLGHQEGTNTLTVKQLENLKKKATQEKINLDIAHQALSEQKQKLIGENRSLGVSNEDLRQKQKNRELITEITEAMRAANGIITEQDANYVDLLAKLDKAKQEQQNINKSIGISGSLLEGLGGILHKLGMGRLSEVLGLDEAQEAMEETARRVTQNGASVAGFSGQMEIFGSGLSSMFSSLAAGLSTLGIGLLIAVIVKGITTIVELFQGLDKSAGDFAKSMNMSYQDAAKTQENLSKISSTYSGLGVTTEKLMKTLQEINTQYQVVGDVTNEQLLTATKLQNISGLSLEDQKGSLALSIQNKQNLDEITGQILAQADISSSKLGVALNEKDVLRDIGKISAATTLSLGKNPKLIADAVSTAKSLGLEMGKIESIMDSMLNFEQSIENELSAELLLGKNINLEKARWAALNNDVATAAKEIATQIGSAADYSKMNRIQQEELAKAVGMSREDLAKTLFIQDQIRGLSGQVAKNREEAYLKLVDTYGIEKAQDALAQGKLNNLEKQMSLSERLSAMFDKLKEIIVPLIAKILPSIAAYFEDVSDQMAKGSGLLSALFWADADSKDSKGNKYIDKYKGLGDEFKAIVPSSTYTRVQTTEDGIAPSSKGPFTITDRYGATSITTKGDGIAVSPNINRTSTPTQSLTAVSPNINRTSTPTQSLTASPVTPTVKVDMRETNSLLRALINKSGNVRIDNTEIGTAFQVNTFSIQ